MQFHRLRTSVEVCRTRTQAAPFSNYLRDGPTARDCAQDITTSALQGAQRAALDVHPRHVDPRRPDASCYLSERPAREGGSNP